MRKLASLLIISVIMIILLAACQPTTIPVEYDLNGTPVVPTKIVVHLDEVAAPVAAVAAPVSAPAAPVVPAPAAGGFRLLAEGECATAGSFVVMKDFDRANGISRVYAFQTDALSTDVCRGVQSWGWRVVWELSSRDEAVAYATGEHQRVTAVMDADPSAPGSNPVSTVELYVDGALQ